MQKSKLISIIVPIYNTAKYLPKCLGSILSQSYKNIEVILVDDGSTDISGKICDQYALNFDRIKVIHTKNGGLSAARNVGLEEATGEWILLLDSDDWLDPDACRKVIFAAQENGSDMVIFRFHKTNEKGTEKRKKKEKIFIGPASRETAVECGKVMVWNKFYKKSLFDDIRFPVGMNYEDFATTHKLIYKAEKITFIPDELYYYRIRKNGLCRERNIQNKKDAFNASLLRYHDLVSYGYPEEKAKKLLMETALSLCTFCSDGPEIKEAEKILSETENAKCFPLKKRAMFKIWQTSKPLFDFVCTKTEIRIGGD